MGRTASFDRESVVRAARTVFWNRGFEQASIPELERETGLSRSSIYNAFGSKRELFDAAVESYLDEIVRPRLVRLRPGSTDASALRDYLTSLRRILVSGETAAVHGCLLLNAAGAPIAEDEAVRETIAAYRAELEAAFAIGARARQPHASDDEIERISVLCTALVVNALLLSRVDAPAAVGSIDTAISLL